MIQELDSFISSNRNFKHAIALYDKYGTNESLKELVRKYPDTSFVKEQLFTAIQELRDKADAIAPKPKSKQQKITSTKLPEKQADDIILQLDKRKGSLFREAAVLHSHLHHMTYQELKKAVPVIVNNWKEIDRIWIIKAEHEKTGLIPKELSNQYSLKDYVNRLKALPTYITKLKKEIDALPAGDDVRTKKEKRLAEFEAELDKLNLIMESNEITIQS